MKQYPLHINILFHITDGDSNGAVTFGFPMNRLPSDDDMTAVLEKVQAVLPDGFRLMTRHESMIYYLREEKGYAGPNNIALPSMKDGDEWFNPNSSTGYMSSDEDEFEDYDL